MSRIIVKNLPKNVTEEQVSIHFSSVGQITDIKLKYKKSGEFRGFCFMGFESEAAANNAIKLSNTYIKKQKITVEKCTELDHKEKEKARKMQQSKDFSSNLKSQKQDFKHALKMKDKITKGELDTLMKTPNFIQYLKLNKRGTADLVDTLKNKFGDMNKKKEDESEQEKENKEESEEEEKGECGEEEKEENESNNQSLANRNISDIEYLQCLMKASVDELAKEKEKKAKKWKTLFTVIVRTREHLDRDKKGKTFTKRGIKEFFRPLTILSLRIPRKLSYVAYVGFKTEKIMNKALQMDKSFLDGTQVKVRKYEEKDSSGKGLNKKEPPWKAAEDKVLKEANPVGDSGRLFVRNLWYSVAESDVKELFEKIGPLADVTLPICKRSQRPKGFAHLTFVFPEHAVKAMNELDGKEFKGRILHILPSLLNEDQEDEKEGKSYQEKKKAEQKKNSTNSHNWHSLFIGSKSVIDLMTRKDNTSKYEILEDKNEASAAVSMAINEAQVVEETKRTLEENGVCLESFSSANVQRSSTVILAKNLPAKTAAVELKEIFEKYGNIGRVVLPPSGVTAIIEFLEPSEAKKAFKEEAYKRFKYLPLYLEWAPFEVFTSKAKKLSPLKESEETKKDDDVTEHKTSEDRCVAEQKTAEDRSPEDNTTLYVKNLNFKTDEETLKMFFSKIGEICSVMIAKRRMMSQGYGFVQFFKTSDANKAIRMLQNSTLDGHDLTIKKSEKKLITQNSKMAKLVENPDEPTTSKILIRNIPFQATFKEIKDLFESAGKVKFLRLPKKVGSSEHRGFGFIEFLTREEAMSAKTSLGASTHLYGRRLVLEWANEDETVEELRSKTAERFLSSGPPKKKLKMETSSNSQIDDEL